MALFESCFCCSLVIAAGFFAVYLLITFLIAFGFELLWILETNAVLPTAALLLCVGYFVLAMFAAILVHGLATKNVSCLVVWLFAASVLIFPEAGMVIYMSVHYWKIETQYGITELICWVARITSNLIEIIIVQSLYSLWKEEELVKQRLHDLSVMMPMARDATLVNFHNSLPGYENNAFEGSLEQLGGSPIIRNDPIIHYWSGTLPKNIMTLPFDGYQFCTQSEFNASIFVPNFVHNDMDLKLPVSDKKAQSLIDLRIIEDSLPIEEKCEKPLQPSITKSVLERSNTLLPNYKESKTKLQKYASVDAINEINKEHHIIKNRTGFYAQPLPNYGVPIYYGPLDGPDFLIYKKQIDKMNSKNSLSNASVDDVQKYRDVAL